VSGSMLCVGDKMSCDMLCSGFVSHEMVASARAKTQNARPDTCFRVEFDMSIM